MKAILGMIVVATVALGSAPAGANGSQGAVYTSTNAVAGNAILAWERGADGTLTPAGSHPTGGNGTGAGLGNQGGVRLTDDGKFLLVVNAGSNDISVFAVSPAGLVLRDREPSGGSTPVSVAAKGRLVYVLNGGGGPDSVVGFWLARDGNLTMIPGSARGLSAAATGPAQVEFSPDGGALVVTEKATNLIDVFAVGHEGLLDSGASYASVGATPFGFAFGKRDQFFVSEAFGGAADASAISSYVLDAAGVPHVISASVPTTETAACWVVVTKDGRFLYTTNTGSNSVSGYAIRPDGTISLLDDDGVTAMTDAGPTDAAFSANGRFLYVLHPGAGTIGAFLVEPHGALMALGVTPIPAGANGLAAD